MESSSVQDIAIVGMACRVAGSNSPSQLWENILTRKDVRRRITRFNIDGYYHPECGSEKGLTNVDHAYMLDDEVVDRFDNAFFHVTPTEAASMDPQQRMLLEVSYEAIENAGIPLDQFTGTNTAVFTGTLCTEGSDYHTVLARDPNTTPKYIVTGTAGCMASNRLSYFYDLSGPSVTVDTACSSSMAALHQAVRTLQHGDSSMALVCGANLIFNVESFITMTELGFLGASGRCRSFDASADGYGRGEGICSLLIMPLEHALSIEAPIRAVIKGTRLNQDGRTQGITLPSTKAQAENMCSLYEGLYIKTNSIQYLEAHGTGTPAGDPLELQAVKDTYLRHPLVVGSVKGNVGHCEAASALVGLIKTVLCLEHQQIPAQMHFDTLNPAIDLTNTNITIPRHILAWPEPFSDPNSTPRAAINTFGAGGTNGHAVLESYAHRPSATPATQRPWLFKVSAADETSLRCLTKSYVAYIESQKPNLGDLAHTLLAHRSSLRHSHFVVASTYSSLLAQLCSNHMTLSKISHAARRLLVVLTGQGAQWMGYVLLDQCPSFKFTLLECDHALQELPHPPAWSILDELSKTRDHSNVDKAEYSQPLCTALQIGLVLLLRSWGVPITAVVGHSSGEIAAAFAAGMISLRDAIVIAYYRGLVLTEPSRIPSTIEPRGAMCAVDMGENECNSILKKHSGHVQLAAVNSEQSRTLSGDRDAIEAIVDLCKKRGSFCRRLNVDKDAPECVIFSSVTGRKIQKRDLIPSYWAKNMTSTVQYTAAINSCVDEYQDLECILEVGPHPVLRSPTQEILRGHHKNEVPYIGTCRRDTDDYESILRSAGELIVAGLPLRTAAINVGYEKSPNGRTDRIQGLSPAICVIMAIEAARQILLLVDKDKPVVRLTDVKFPKSILCPASAGEQRDFEIQLISKLEDGSSQMTFEIFRSSPSVKDGWQLCSTGALDIASKPPELSDRRSGSSYHDPLLSSRAHSLQPDMFALVENLKIGNGEINGDVPKLQPSWQKYTIHPVALASVLSLGPTSVVGQILPAKHCLSSISELDIQINSGPSDLLTFSVDTRSILAGGAMSEIEVSDGTHGALAGRAHYTATEILPLTPIATSLFFKPVFLPDITKFTGTKDLTFEDCVQLLTHKWPMSDILIDTVATDIRKRILRAFNTRSPGKRKRFRSILVVADVQEPDTVDSVQYVGKITSGFQAHMIFVDKIMSFDWLHGYLQPGGLVCMCSVQETPANYCFKHLNYVCELTDTDNKIGTVWRVKDNLSTLLPRNRKITFCNRDFELKNALQISLAPEEIKAFTSLNTSAGRFDAILIDDLERSIIATWPGNDLIPWLQHIMKQANSLLWVTQDASSSPFVDIAGTLLRTLQAEQPSLKVSWLCVNQSERNDVTLLESINTAYTSMMQGENEVRLDMDDTGTRVVRYLPDEDIAAATGVALPRVVDSPIGDKAYELSLAAPHEPVVLSYDSGTDHRNWNRSVTPQQQRRPTLDDDLDDERAFNDSMEGYTKVMVEASIINSDDVAAYNGRIDVPKSAISKNSKSPTLALGTFFAGKVLISTGSFSRGSWVVGWAEGQHVNAVIVPTDRIVSAEEYCLDNDLILFASLTTAMAVLEGHIRARKGDHIHLANMGLVLHGAFTAVCHYLALETVQNNDRPTFCIEISGTGEILVDKTPINIHKYLNTCPHPSMKLWGDLKQRNGFVSSKSQCFPIRFHKAAFEAAMKSKDPVVLLHRDLEGTAHVPIYCLPTRLCTSKGAYIIIGGLGGLGRYTCSWLVIHGITSIYAISRSGISSPEAQALYDSLNSNPNINLSVIKADACNRTQISSILSSIRTKEPIIGVINMAMILGDAPMASMTGEEWDRALKVKIESSWILHEETKRDELEAFVLFSSIA
ncbi:MAG: hypothetical protein Q9226_006354, partial [Calogaya cf. arnoldii]